MKQEKRLVVGVLAKNPSQKYLSTSKCNVRRLVLIVGLAAMFLPHELSSAQRSSASRLRYRIFDVGTFGGPNSQTNGTSRVMNNRGVVAGMADSDQPCPHVSGLSEFVSPAFRWRNGVLNNLGLLPGGCGSLPNSINDRGTIVGVSDNDIVDPQTGITELHPDIRRNGHIDDLGTFGGHHGLSSDVNSQDIVVGGAETEDPDPFDFGGSVILGLPSPTAWRAFAWIKGKLHNLGTLGGPDSFAFFINDLNEINGVSFTNAIPNPETGLPTVEPFIWKNGHMRSLGTLGGTFGYVANISNNSEIVGYSYLAGNAAAHAYDWKHGQGMRDLEALGGNFSEATWVNEAGEIVGGSTTNDGLFHAVRWRRGHIEDLGTVAGLPCSVAVQVNARGEIAGQSFDCADFSNGRATLWKPNGSGIDLNVFLPPGSDLTLYETHFVNDRGEIVVVGILPNGDQHIVVMVPCSDRESEDCRGARDETAISNKLSGLDGKPSRLNPDSLFAIRARMNYRFRGISRQSPK
jgi:probable HAF family extracellular repeat protein